MSECKYVKQSTKSPSSKAGRNYDNSDSKHFLLNAESREARDARKAKQEIRRNIVHDSTLQARCVTFITFMVSLW